MHDEFTCSPFAACPGKGGGLLAGAAVGAFWASAMTGSRCCRRGQRYPTGDTDVVRRRAHFFPQQRSHREPAKYRVSPNLSCHGPVGTDGVGSDGGANL